MAGVVAFTSAAKRHREKITTLSFTPGSAATLLTSGALAQIKPYPYLRDLILHVYATAAGTGGSLNPDAPWNILQSITFADTNGTAIYGSPAFTGYDAMCVHALGGYKGGTVDPRLNPLYAASATSPEFWLRIPFEFNPRTGSGSLPNMSSAATYNLTIYGNTLSAIYQTNPTTTPTLAVDVILECWTLPEAQDLLGRNQMQGPPFLGTTQYVTKQTFTGLTGTTTATGANTLTLTRKGNLTRKYIFVTRDTNGVRIPAVAAGGGANSGGYLPNPFEFWWDANRLTSDDPRYLQQAMVETQSGAFLQTSNLADLATAAAGLRGVISYDFATQYGSNQGADGEGGWLATTQSSRLEFIGNNWGNGNTTGTGQVDLITIDVAPIALANQYALDSQTGKLMYPAQPEIRG